MLIYQRVGGANNVGVRNRRPLAFSSITSISSLPAAPAGSRPAGLIHFPERQPIREKQLSASG
jgi:hypothetical protein